MPGFVLLSQLGAKVAYKYEMSFKNKKRYLPKNSIHASKECPKKRIPCKYLKISMPVLRYLPRFSF